MAKDISSLYGKSVRSRDDSSIYPDMMGDYYYKDTDSIKLTRPSFIRRLFRKIKECLHFCKLCKYRKVRRLFRRIKECPHFCKLCKYRAICDISWWKNESKRR